VNLKRYAINDEGFTSLHDTLVASQSYGTQLE